MVIYFCVGFNLFIYTDHWRRNMINRPVKPHPLYSPLMKTWSMTRSVIRMTPATELFVLSPEKDSGLQHMLHGMPVDEN